MHKIFIFNTNFLKVSSQDEDISAITIYDIANIHQVSSCLYDLIIYNDGYEVKILKNRLGLSGESTMMPIAYLPYILSVHMCIMSGVTINFSDSEKFVISTIYKNSFDDSFKQIKFCDED